ncbi:DUF6503 family protein [Constantimarinum furrinae]|uniref:Outer membrane lipoprotein-sorting protein n=1 Tax=Constantimarinum furrinae TaxID=2562285 RepID=A0A7G8PVL6_9FLAO|nr:DUF6503 family protein [Constantimarinum furrinae]QNJ98382.1 hypothetical protein ALE3EI_1834 [Constantimarinum furrinae]
MKTIMLCLFSLLILASCKDEKKDEMPVIHDTVAVEDLPKKKEYPEVMNTVFEAHGGLATWNKFNNVCFEMDGKNGTEVHTISLPNRHTKIETEDWTIGYDGTDVWLLENKPDSYKGNARFYHNLMFYFYAMPFILSDDGIIYEILPSAELKGKNYDAVKISYNSGVGDSPEDEYIIYVDPDTRQMEWLGYTVTYTDQVKSNDWHYIKYDKWQSVNGVMLPEKLTWYNVKDNKPTGEKSDMRFKKVTATETILAASTFKKPDGAVVIER